MIGLRLFIDGNLVAGSAVLAADDPTGLYATGSLAITWGRSTSIDQPSAATCTFTLVRPNPVDWLRVGRQVAVTGVTTDGVELPVFVGVLTSQQLGWDADSDLPLLQVIADDVLADLGQRRVAATPWAKERFDERVGNVMDAARRDVPYSIDPGLAAFQVAKQDVDTLFATPVLQHLAASLDSVLWTSAVKSGTTTWTPTLDFEDTTKRPALRRLALRGGLIVIVLDDAAIAAVAITLDSCLFDRDPAQFAQAIDDVVTGISVLYLVPSTDDPTQLQQLTLEVIDQGAESPTGVWGVRRIELDTLLTNVVDAQTIGDRILSRLRQTNAWRAGGLTLDTFTSPLPDDLLSRLLDLRYRSGLPLKVTLPSWAPNAEPLVGFLEGGQINYDVGWWDMTLTVSSASAYGAADATWNDLPDDPAWIWNNWASSIRWDDLFGVGGP